METIFYIVARIDGDYAMLQREDAPDEDLKQVAMAFMPAGISEGDRVKYELFQYDLA